MKTRILLTVMLGLVGMSGKGQVMFQKTYDINGYTMGTSARQTTDGGYIMTGLVKISGLSLGVGLVKTNVNGDILWTKTYQTSLDGSASSVQQTNDGGYILIGGLADSITDTINVFLIKTDVNGGLLWAKRYGGNNVKHGYGYSVKQTSDGGYIIVGYTNSFGVGDNDVYLIKINSTGGLLWSKTFGGTGDDRGYSVQQTSDGGFIIAGCTKSFGAGLYDVYLIKTNSSGTLMWSKTYGGVQNEYGYSVQQTTDGGYIIVGNTTSFTAGNRDVYLLKTDANGNLLWTKSFGGTDDDYASLVQQTTDGGYVFTGSTKSFGGGYYDAYLIKTNSSGVLLWSKAYGGTGIDNGCSVQQTTDGGYVVAGFTHSFATSSEEFYLIKTDANGNSGCHQSNPSTIQGSTSTIVGTAATQVSSGCVVTSISIVTGTGGSAKNACYYGLNEKEDQVLYIHVSPNPFTTQATLTIQGIKNDNYKTLSVYNLLGQEVQNIFVGSATSITINRNNMPSGMYFYKLCDDNKTVLGMGKMMVE